MSEVFGDATVYKGVNAKTGKSKTAKQMKSGNKWAWAACSTSNHEESSTPAVRNCVPKGGLDSYSEHYEFYPNEGIISRDQARSVCQNLGAGWDLAIISNKNEYNFIADSIDDNCWNHMAWWVGFNEYDTVSPGVAGTVETIFGKANEWELKWDVDSNFGVVQAEPNDQKGVEECVRMMERKLNDAICADGWTGVKKANVGMGFVCEKHNTIEYCQPGKVPDMSDTYKVVTGAGLNWDDSRAACQAVGDGWDLVVINDQDEHDVITEQINCANNAFWVGHKEANGQMYDLDGNQVFMDNWDNHSNVLNPEANNQQGDEQCVRIRGDVMNDALCDRTWTGAERLNIPMGYICEYNAPVCKVKNNARPLQDDEYKIFPQNAPNTWSWNQARQMCKDLGKHWDLAIFNYDREYVLLNEILAENCVNDHAYWIGYNEDGGDASTVYGNAVSPGTNLGATTSIALPWDAAANEPNDNLGEERCVRMNQFGTTNDAICSRTWTGGPKLEMGMGVICEKHNPCESQRGQPTVEYSDDRYYISTAQYISADDAKAACQARGEFWDLAIIDDVKEHKELNSKLGGCIPYWLGMTNPTGSKLLDHDGNDVLFAMWDTHLGTAYYKVFFL